MCIEKKLGFVCNWKTFAHDTGWVARGKVARGVGFILEVIIRNVRLNDLLLKGYLKFIKYHTNIFAKISKICRRIKTASVWHHLEPIEYMFRLRFYPRRRININRKPIKKFGKSNKRIVRLYS